MKLSTLPKLKEAELKQFLTDLLVSLKEEEKRKEDGAFMGEKFHNVLGLPTKKPTSYEETLKYTTQLVNELDLLDMDDTFGTEGWRHRFLGDD